MIICEH